MTERSLAPFLAHRGVREVRITSFESIAHDFLTIEQSRLCFRLTRRATAAGSCQQTSIRCLSGKGAKKGMHQLNSIWTAALQTVVTAVAGLYAGLPLAR